MKIETMKTDEKSLPNCSEPISKAELSNIQRLSHLAFESAFDNQLRSERRQSLLTIYFMKEAYRRRNWSESHSSFGRYCIEKMKMSDSDFYRKFAIMRTLDELPEIEAKIMDGTLSPSTVSKAIQFLNKESKIEERVISRDEKRDLFCKIENLSERQVERELAFRSPEAAIPDRVRQISENGYYRQFTSDQRLEAKLSRAKEILAHSFKGAPTDCELFHRLVDAFLEKHDPACKDQRKAKREALQKFPAPVKSCVKDYDVRVAEKIEKRGKSNAANTNETVDQVDDAKSVEIAATGESDATAATTDIAAVHASKLSARNSAPRREHLTAEVNRKVRLTYDYQCAHINPRTGDRCKSRFATEVDHVIPVARGGTDDVKNLRLVCRTHNQHYAIQTFGREKNEPASQMADLKFDLRKMDFSRKIAEGSSCLRSRERRAR